MCGDYVSAQMLSGRKWRSCIFQREYPEWANSANILQGKIRVICLFATIRVKKPSDNICAHTVIVPSQHSAQGIRHIEMRDPNIASWQFLITK